VQTIQSMLTAEDVQLADVLAQLRLIAAALAMPNLQPEAAETTWGAKRLIDCTTAARQEISAAMSALSEE